MEEFKDLPNLLKRLESVEETICIEGFCGSGKSCLAATLSIRPPRCVIRIDSFAKERKAESNFSDLVDLERLDAAMITIYVKRISAGSGIWHDAPDLQSPSAHWLQREVLNYHERFEPHERADIVYVRTEN